MYEDLKTLLWFLRRGPKFYATMIALILRKFRPFRETPEHLEIERKWCEENLISYEECMNKLGFKLIKTEVFSPDHLKEVKGRLEISESDFGGQGASIHYKAWVCSNPDCGFNIKIRNGDVYINEPITSGAMHTPRVR